HPAAGRSESAHLLPSLRLQGRPHTGHAGTGQRDGAAPPAYRGPAAADPAAAVVAWIEEYLGIGWDERRARDGRTFLSPEVGLTTGIAGALEETYARHRQVVADVLARGREDGSLPGARPERDAFAIHAVV